MLVEFPRTWLRCTGICAFVGRARQQLEDWLQAFAEERWGRVWPQLEDDFLASYLQAMLRQLLDWKDRYSALRLLLRLPELSSEVMSRV